MAEEIQTQKINHLLKSWSKGAVFTSNYLEKKGFSAKLVNWYKSSGWLDSLGHGAYKRSGETIEWYGGLSALQAQMNLPVHPGGKTALELLGYAHYLSEQMREVQLFGRRENRLPQWFKKYDWKVSVNYYPTNLFPIDLKGSFTDYNHKEIKIRISSPERAALEMLYLVPQEQGFDEASHITENLTTLRPELVQKLLENCNSIKAKRLFLHLAEKHNHDWFEQLVLSNVDLGTGKRVIVKGGKLDKKYEIVVPQERDY